jgi:putative ABC transport system ATP-binding protein
MPDTVFTAKALTKTYVSGETQVLALRALDLEIFAGEVVVLLGPSGSGKSTLLNIMGGLDHATSGQLHFRDLELTNLGDRGLTAYRRQHVGFVFQFYNLIPSLTAYENVALVTEIRSPDASRRSPRARRARGAHAPLPGTALGRRTATRGYCPGDSQTA